MSDVKIIQLLPVPINGNFCGDLLALGSDGVVYEFCELDGWVVAIQGLKVGEL